MSHTITHPNHKVLFAAHVATAVSNVHTAGGMTINESGEFVVDGAERSNLLNVVLKDVIWMAGSTSTNEYIEQLANDKIEEHNWFEFMEAVTVSLDLDITSASY